MLQELIKLNAEGIVVWKWNSMFNIIIKLNSIAPEGYPICVSQTLMLNSLATEQNLKIVNIFQKL